VSVRDGSCGSGRGNAGRRRDVPAANSRGGAAPEKAESGLPEADSGRSWALEHARGTSKPLGHSSGRCGVWGGARGGGRGSAQQSSPACGAPASTEGYGLRICMKKVRGNGLVLTGVQIEQRRRIGSWRRSSAAAHGRSRGRSSRRRVLGVASGSRIRRGDVQRCCEGGSGVSESQESPAARNFPNSSSPSTAGSRENSGARRAGVEG